MPTLPIARSLNRGATAGRQVLIAGAGPTGLVLALWLNRLGVAVRIIDEAAEPGTTSRALAVQARTLELYDQLGLATEVVSRGLPIHALNMWARGEHEARVDFGGMGEGVSPYPYVLMFPQDQHEKLLIEHLARAGVHVERRTKLVGFEEHEGCVSARLRGTDGGDETTCEAAFLAGCDGASSAVREGLGVGFPGGTYERVFYVADVVLRGGSAGGARSAPGVVDHELHIALDDADFLAVFPMKGEHAARLVGAVRTEEAGAHKMPTWESVSPAILERMKITVDRVNWFSTYRVHHRVAEHFRRGRVFLAGDAAHIHSPVGGQGMNTGIGDAINLAWKLAAVMQRRAADDLLDTYEPERIAFARRLVSTTDRIFTLATREGSLARHVRLDVMPRIVPSIMEHAAARRFLFRTVSQTEIRYRHAAWSEGHAGTVHGGDRLPWVRAAQGEGDRPDNFAPLASLAWQVHVYGEPSADVRAACAGRALPVHVFPFAEDAKSAGLAENAVYLVRPDGYVALADPHARAETLLRYLDAHEIRAEAKTQTAPRGHIQEASP